MENTQYRFQVDSVSVGRRLDLFLVEAFGSALKEEGDRGRPKVWPKFSRTYIKARVVGGDVWVDSETVTQPSFRLRGEEEIRMRCPEPLDSPLQKEDIPLNIVYEDEFLLVVDKPAGLVVHPGAGQHAGTMVNGLLAHCGESLSGIGGVKRPGIVHRLDKDTSGLLVVAKQDSVHRALSQAFSKRGKEAIYGMHPNGSNRFSDTCMGIKEKSEAEFNAATPRGIYEPEENISEAADNLYLKREYYAFVWGVPDRLRGSIQTEIGRHPVHRLKMAVVSGGGGRKALTHWRIVETFGPWVSLVACRLGTGRTHQIRVHMEYMRHPLVGDPLYGKDQSNKRRLLPASAQALLENLSGQALHATLLEFRHPVTGVDLSFSSPLPEVLSQLVHILRTEM